MFDMTDSYVVCHNFIYYRPSRSSHTHSSPMGDVTVNSWNFKPWVGDADEHKVYCRVWEGVAVGCTVLQCVAVCCSVLQCVAVCCSGVQSGVECFSVL